MTDPRDVERLDSLQPYLPPGWDASLSFDDELAAYAAAAEASNSLRRSRARRRHRPALRIDNVVSVVAIGALIATVILCWVLHA